MKSHAGGEGGGEGGEGGEGGGEEGGGEGGGQGGGGEGGGQGGGGEGDGGGGGGGDGGNGSGGGGSHCGGMALAAIIASWTSITYRFPCIDLSGRTSSLLRFTPTACGYTWLGLGRAGTASVVRGVWFGSGGHVLGP